MQKTADFTAETLLFVYGTLKRGDGNYFRLLHNKEGVEFVAKAVTVKKYSMMQSGIPYVSKNDENHKANIQGEVFKVSDIVLSRIDILEGHPDWYYREKIPVKCVNGTVMDAFIYFNESGHGVYVEDGLYKEGVYGGRPVAIHTI